MTHPDILGTRTAIENDQPAEPVGQISADPEVIAMGLIESIKAGQTGARHALTPELARDMHLKWFGDQAKDLRFFQATHNNPKF